MKYLLPALLFFLVPTHLFASDTVHQQLIQKIKDVAYEINQNHEDKVDKDLFITFFKPHGENIEPYFTTLKTMLDLTYSKETVYFILGNIEFDQNDQLIRRCYKTNTSKYPSVQSMQAQQNYDSICINQLFFEKNRIRVEYTMNELLEPGALDNLYGRSDIIIKYKPIDNTYRLESMY